MHAPTRARVVLVSSIALGGVVLVVALLRVTAADPELLALLALAAVVAETIRVKGDPAADELHETQTFSFSSGVHIASVLVLGPLAGALVAALGVVVVDSSRGEQHAKVAFNASMLAVAAFSAGVVFETVGGTPGAISLPRDFVPIGALALTLYLVNTMLVSAIVAATTNGAFRGLWRASFLAGFDAAVGETGLGLALALLLGASAWSILALAPLLLALYQASARLTRLRMETARALETFAEVVDERDPSTYRHSARVAASVEAFARGVGADAPAAARLRRAGQLHDLGKIAVDTATLRKPAALDAAEWEAMRRHPNLSARLVRSFRLADEEAAAIEYHHERYDGEGYYGMAPREVPLSAHVLAVADSYDAMTSDRPYRRSLAPEEALEEILRGAGTHFHPAVAKAFVAVQRGEDPLAPLDGQEREALNLLGTRSRGVAPRFAIPTREAVAILSGSALVAAVGLALFRFAVPAAIVAAPGLAVVCLRVLDARRRIRLEHGLRSIAEGTLPPARMFDSLVASLAGATPVAWGALARWDARLLDMRLDLLWNPHAAAPGEAALASWLGRLDPREGFILGTGAPGQGTPVAIPLDGGEEGATAWLLLAFEGGARAVAVEALRGAAGAIALALAPVPVRPERRERIAAVG